MHPVTPEGGFFLAQDFDLEQYEQQVKDLEMIDRDRDVGAEHERGSWSCSGAPGKGYEGPRSPNAPVQARHAWPSESC